MESFVFNVTYNGTITESVVVDAKTKEEAIERIKNNDVDDVIDVYTETHERIDIREV